MIRIFNKQLVAVESGSVYVADIYCDSSDTKPTTELANGSTLTEVDTGKRYLFNEATTSWVEVSGGGGGGSTNTKTHFENENLALLPEEIENIASTLFGHSTVEENFVGLATAMGNGDASMMITIKQGGNTMAIAPLFNTPGFGYISMQAAQSDFSQGAYLSLAYNAENDYVYVLTANMLMSGQVINIKSMLTNYTFDLDVYYHPMPTA